MRHRLGALLVVLALLAVLLPGAAHALEPILVTPDQDRIEITPMGEVYEGRGDSLQIEAVSGAEGMSARMSVKAATPGTNPNWIVFVLKNASDRAIERWLTADRYNIVGSGIVWPDLDARRIEAVTPSLGFVPERIKSDRADVFRITLEPGQAITYVAELSSERFARIYLWKPLDYELKVRERQLFNGIMLGLTGLLAIFLTAIFAANHKIIFPAAALVSWCVLAYLCVDFGFFHRLFNLRPDDNAVYRAATEASMAASILMFVYVFLRLQLGHGLLRMLASVWIIAQLSLIAVAVVDPRLASTFARFSFVAIGGLGAIFTLFLALRGQDRALSLIPTWLLLLVWTFAAGVVLTGRLTGDLAVSGLIAGLVLIVLLIGFTVTQFAFRSMEPHYGSAPSELQLRALAIEGAGAAVWEWNARRDEVKFSPEVEAGLGLNHGELSCKVDDFLKHVHPGDIERVRQILWSVQERAGGRIKTAFRMRHADNTYRWIEIEASSVDANDRRAVRCVGLVRDVTDIKRSQERLMHDAVNCSLTGLPNRELFLDRLNVAVARAKSEPAIRPTVLMIDIDKFRSANSSFGLVVGDSLLLTLSRRLQRHLSPQDTLSRVGGDQFAILFLGEQDAAFLAGLAERIRRSLRSPIKIAGQEIVLTGALGIAVYDGEQATGADLFREAETAMLRAKRGGSDRIEIFRPEMRGETDDRITIESDLRKALDKSQIKVLYQPIIYLPTEELAGFEALVRWQHPKLGLVNPAMFVPVAEESDLIVKLGSYVLLRSAAEVARWQKELPRVERPLFVSVNVSSKQLFRQDLIQEIRHILGRATVPKGSLRLEVTESLVMENPEQATEILELLRSAGAELAMDDFGTGYSSLAYLQRFPFDIIKIDRLLIEASRSGDGAGLAIVRSLVALVHELGKKVVAEGVETPDDVSFLRSVGTEYAQGFYYGEPMPEREVINLLRMVKKAERKMQPRGMFRARSGKSAKRKAKEAEAAQAAQHAHQPGDGAAPESSRATSADGSKPSRPVSPPATAPGPFKTRPRPMPERQPGPQAQPAAHPGVAKGNGAGGPYPVNGSHPAAAQQIRPSGPPSHQQATQSGMGRLADALAQMPQAPFDGIPGGPAAGPHIDGAQAPSGPGSRPLVEPQVTPHQPLHPQQAPLAGGPPPLPGAPGGSAPQGPGPHNGLAANGSVTAPPTHPSRPQTVTQPTRPSQRPDPDLSKLSPALAASLARLAGSGSK